MTVAWWLSILLIVLAFATASTGGVVGAAILVFIGAAIAPDAKK